MLFTVNCISITEDSVETISFVASIGYDPLPLSAGIWSSITVLVSVPYPGFAGYKFKVNYDASKLTLAEIVNGTFEGGMFQPNLDKNTVVYANTTDLKGDGTLFTLKFTVKEDCSNGAAVEIENIQVANAAQKIVPVTIVAGGVNVNDTTGGSTTGGSTTGGSTTGGSTTGGSTTGGSTTGGSTTGGSTTGGSTTGGSTTGGSTTGGSTTGGSTTGGSTTGGSTTGGSTTGGSTTGGDTTVDYKIIEGANGAWTQNSDGTLTFRANGEFSKFTGVKVDGKLIDRENYTAKSGSTIVTLSKDYLATLPVGNHSLTVVFNDGECSTDFTVKAAGDNTNPGDNTKPGETVTPGNNADGPQTGDHSSIVLAVAVLLVSGGALTVLAIAKKKAGKC